MADISDELAGEEVVDSQSKLYGQAQYSNLLKDRFISILKEVRHDRMSLIYDFTKELSIAEYYFHKQELTMLVNEFE